MSNNFDKKPQDAYKQCSINKGGSLRKGGPDNFIIPLGPYHPLFEEPEFFQLVVDGETVVDINVRIGYNHRGIEKLAETKNWDQDTFLIERVCGICSTSHPFAYVSAVEDILGVDIPPRAKYIRCVIGELERIHSHLLWFGLAGHFLGYNTVFMWAWKQREYILDMCERLTGNRNHYAMFKPGGVRRDFTDEAIDWTLEKLKLLWKPMKMFVGAVMDDPVIHARTKNVGVLTYEDAVKWCALGPTSRASGVPWDIRATDPYAAYGELLDKDVWKVIVLPEGDVFAKVAVRLLEIIESMKITQYCLENLPPGDIDLNIKEVPAGEGCGHAEAPRGEVFHYVRSDGTNTPVRHKIRAPTFMNLPTFQSTCRGEDVADVAIITAAIDPCYCCTERVQIMDKKHGLKKVSEKDLVKLSSEKTKKIRQKMGITEDPFAKMLRG